MSRNNKINNDFDSFLNECNTYIWEWYIPERYVKFGIPSLNGSWIDDKTKMFKLATVLEKVHPDDIAKVFVRRNSPLYKSDEMFELDLRINAHGTFEYFGVRGRTQKRDKDGNPTYVRGVAINIQNRVNIQKKLQSARDHQLQNERQKTDYCVSVLQEVVSFIGALASNADSIITGDAPGTREERLMKINNLRKHCERILDLNDKVKHFILRKNPDTTDEIKQLSLWEHLAELQQVISLKVHGVIKLYFSNLYDDVVINVNVKLLNLLIENAINSQIHNTHHGYITMSYAVDKDNNKLVLTIACTENEAVSEKFEQILTENGLGLSVCKMLATRMYGDIVVTQSNDNRLQYTITLPMDAHFAMKKHYEEMGMNDPSLKFQQLIDRTEIEDENVDTQGDLVGGKVLVLIGTNVDMSVMSDQSLFNVVIGTSSDKILEVFVKDKPDIVFLDKNMEGATSIEELIEKMHALDADTPIIVSMDYANRTYHRLIRSIGAKYLLNNPLSLRKVNLMIKKYLK